MKTAKFYRLEHRDTKKGVYRNGDYEVEKISGKFNDNRHPSPSCDSKLGQDWNNLNWNEKERYVFGFCTFNQFRSWFYKDSKLKKFEELGIVLNVYETQKYIKGHTQMVAEKQSLKFIKTYPILGS